MYNWQKASYANSTIDNKYHWYLLSSKLTINSTVYQWNLFRMTLTINDPFINRLKLPLSVNLADKNSHFVVPKNKHITFF